MRAFAILTGAGSDATSRTQACRAANNSKEDAVFTGLMLEACAQAWQAERAAAEESPQDLRTGLLTHLTATTVLALAEDQAQVEVDEAQLSIQALRIDSHVLWCWRTHLFSAFLSLLLFLCCCAVARRARSSVVLEQQTNVREEGT